MRAKELNDVINRVIQLIRKGYSRGMIISEMMDDIDVFPKEKIFEIAKCRIKAKEKFGEISNKLFFDEDGLRYSTPPEVARYRADKLNYGVIADVSCGVGIQALYFAMKSDKVIAIEKDPIRLKLAQLNAESFGIENIHFIQGDAISRKIASRVKADVIFSDPSRKPEEPVRTLDTLSPPPVKIYKTYRKLTDKIAFELPPQISRENITLDGEKEYTSLGFRLNRLALYTNSLKSCDVSAVSLPSRERISDEDEKIYLEPTDHPLEYVYEVDPTLSKANLVDNMVGKLEFDGYILLRSKRRTLLTSNHVYDSAFLKRYTLLAICRFNIPLIKSILKKLDVGKVTLRIEIDPKSYWAVRNEIESSLSGEKRVDLFKVRDRAIIVERSF